MTEGQRRGLELLKRILASPKCPPFSKWDTDGDGFISPEELRSMFAKGPKIMLTPSMLADIVAVVDQDNDGQVNLQEFSRFAAKTKEVAALRQRAAAAGVTSVTPTTSELSDPKLAYSKLWDLDVNRLVPGKDYELDMQTYTTTSRGFRGEDWATKPLFKSVDKAVFERGTFKLFKDLLDNYEREIGKAEKITAEEIREEKRFVDIICKSKPMKYVQAYCMKKGWGPYERSYKAARSSSCSYAKRDWNSYVRRIWFEMYPRVGGSRIMDSCGFEHVFVGEMTEDKQGKPTVKGLHNWVMFYIEEQKGTVDYKGYLDSKYAHKNGQPDCHLLGLQFAWEGKLKPASTMFAGTTPEFEMALYTLAWADQAHEEGEQDILVTLGGYNAELKCYAMTKRGTIDHGVKMSSCFPEIVGDDAHNAAAKLQAVQRGRMARRGGRR